MLPLPRFGSVQVAADDCMPAEDSNRDPRVYLAAERTFLAWIRTSLALMAFGFVVSRFGLFLRVLESSSGATSFRAFRAFASAGSFSGAAGSDRRHFRGVPPREVRARDRPRIANHRTAFDACGRARCDSCRAGVGDGVLSGNYDEVTPSAAQYTEEGTHFYARGRESMRYLRTDQARPSGCFPAVSLPVISRVFKSITAT